MGRKKRGWIDNACYHITHRCHGRKFLFRYEKYRDYYVRTLFQAQRRYDIDVLNYVVTSNHVHLLVTAEKSENISNALRYLHGCMALFYNRERDGEGAFWSDRFHSTCIQSGNHFARCLFYIDLNMVRTGVVKHPSKWKHCGYHEIIRKRQRYSIINRERLLQVLYMNDFNKFRRWYKRVLDDKIINRELSRQTYWSKAIAVGEPEWLEDVSGKIGLKRYRIKNINPDDIESDCYIGRGC